VENPEDIKYWNAEDYLMRNPNPATTHIYGIKKSTTGVGGSRKRRKSICKNYNKKCKHYTKKYKLKHKIKHKNTNRQKYQKRI